MYWDELTSPQIEQLDRSIPVILPVSATEQHGYHLPLATDRMIGEHICKNINEEIEDEILILPNISVGCSEHHKDFAGSLSIQHSTMLAQMTDIAECIVEYGFKNIFVANSHGGNQAIAQTFLETFGYRHPEVNVAFTSWWRIANEEIKNIQESGPGGVGHAGEFETSLMLTIAPHLVHLDKVEERANLSTYNWAEADLISGSKVSLYRRMNEVTTNGVQGEPKYATKAKGELLTKKIVEVYVKILRDYRIDI